MRFRILALAPNYWDDQWMNRQQILSRLAKDHDILYSNGPWSVWERGQERFRAATWTGSFERLDGVLVDRPPKLLLSWPSHQLVVRGDPLTDIALLEAVTFVMQGGLVVRAVESAGGR